MIRTVFLGISALLCLALPAQAFDDVQDLQDILRTMRSTSSPTTPPPVPESFESFYATNACLPQQRSLDPLCDHVNNTITHEETVTHQASRNMNISHTVAHDPLGEMFSGKMFKGKPAERETLNVLCFDGGGVRAIATLTILCQLEAKTGKKVYELFDRLYGTSTGGIAALLFAFGYSAPQVLDIYFDHMQDVFHRDIFDKVLNPFGIAYSAYGNEGLSRIIDYYMHPIAIGAVQAGKSLKDVRKMMDIYDKKTGIHASPVLMKEARIPVGVVAENYETHETIMISSDSELTYNNLVRSAALATSAAPTYFPAQDIIVGDQVVTCIDGGVSSNNPSLQAYKHIKLYKHHINPAFPHDKSKRKNVHILSLGTGAIQAKPLHRNTGKLGFANIANIPHYFMNSASATIDGDMREIAAQKPYVDYTRVSFALPERIDLADTSDHAKEILQKAAMSVLWDNTGSFGVYVKGRENDGRPHPASAPILKQTQDDLAASHNSEPQIKIRSSL